MAEVGVMIDGILRLVKKSADELLHPGQLLVKERRQELVRRGTEAMRSLLVKKAAYAMEVKRLKDNLQKFETPGLEVYLSTSIPAIGFIPEGEYDVRYWHNALNPLSTHKADLTFSAPTYEFSRKMIDVDPTTIEYVHEYPSEGLRTSAMDIVEFAKRKPGDQVQHGGMFFDQAGNLQILDYDELTKKKKDVLNPGEVLMEANWYISSDNKDNVLCRLNLQHRLAFNGVGVMSAPNKPDKYFFVSRSDKTNLLASKLLDKSKMFVLPINPSLVQVAAMAEILTKVSGYEKWRLAGTEYNGGGMWKPSIQDEDRTNHIHSIEFRRRQSVQ